MSSIKFRCPACEKKLAIPKSAAGKKIRCPNCNVKISIPYLNTPGTSSSSSSRKPAGSSSLATEVLEQTIRELKEKNKELTEKVGELQSVQASDGDDAQAKILQLNDKVHALQETINAKSEEEEGQSTDFLD